jgi:GNAT superfamily N-acetyltransferase
MMKVEFKKVSENEIETLCQLGKSTFYETFSSQNTAERMEMYLQDAFSPVRIKSELKDANNSFFFVCLNAKPIGYIKLKYNAGIEFIHADEALEIERFYLTKDYYGKGIALQMMEHCVDIAMRLHKKIVWLGVWELNPRAMRFYEKMNFKPCGRKVFLMVDEEQWDVLMKLDLPERNP